MSGMILWLIIVMFIVIRSFNAAKKNAEQARPNVPRKQKPVNNQRPVQQSRPNTQKTGSWSTGSAKKTTAQQGTWNGSYASQQRKSNVPRQQSQENTILQKAKANTAKQFGEDTLEARKSAELNRVPLGDEIMIDKAQARHIHSTHEGTHEAELKNQAGVDDFDTYHLMDEVNDLIVKGYSGNLEFERDFLAEATDMLNRMYG